MSGLKMTFIVMLFLLLSVWGLVGCASSPATVTEQEPAIYTNEDPAADFSAYRTYNYVDPLAIAMPDGIQPLVGTFVVNAIDREMQHRGFTQSDTPDLLVNFDLNMETRMMAGSTRVQQRYSRARYGPWAGYQNTVQEYTEGSLVIDLVDARKKVMVWEGLAQGYIRTKVVEIKQERVNEVVGLIFAEFSHRVP